MADQPDDLEKFNEMVSRALQRLTRWAFPDSQVERKDQVSWLVWHTTENNKKYIDVSVELQIKNGKPASFLISNSVQPRVARLTREDLDDALRIAICSLS